MEFGNFKARDQFGDPSWIDFDKKMQTTLNRKGRITQLTIKDQQKAAVASFRGGYIKFFFTEKDVPDDLMLGDEVEVSVLIKGDE